MRRHSPRLLSLAVLACLTIVLVPPAPAPGASPRSMTIVTRDYYVSRIGPFRPIADPRVSAAIRAFGRPSTRSLEAGTCRIDWRRLRLRIHFANFGGTRPGQTTCTSSVGRAQTFVARGTRFRTANGLRVGDATSSIRRKHPEAQFRRGSWALVLAQFPFGGTDEPSPVLSARVGGGRVRALEGYIGGAGE